MIIFRTKKNIRGGKMQTVKIGFVTLCFAFCFLAGPASGADVAKIGIVNFQKILEVSSAGKKAQAEINREGKKLEADLKAKGEEIDEIKKKLEREALVMSADMRLEREREIRIKINDLKTLQQKYMNDFKVQEQRLVGRIQKAVFEIVEEIGKKEGYLLILEKREAGVLYAPSPNDITDQLIQKYNAQYDQQQEKSAKSKKE
jgi:outer membrane protein